MNKLLSILVLTGIVTLTVPQPNSSDALGDVPECVLAEQWVAANRDALPTTLDAFLEHSVVFRHVIFDALDGAARASLWREHLAVVVEEVTSPRQRAFIEMVSRQLDGDLMDTGPQSRIEALEEEARAVLGDALTRRAIYVLGPEADPTMVNAEEQQGPLCYCRVKKGFGDCEGAYRCSRSAVFPCVKVRDCGAFGWWRCDGLCRNIVN